MLKKDKRKQRMIRLYDGDWKKIREKVAVDNITYQKLVEILLREYITGNKYIEKIVQRYVIDKQTSKKRNGFTEFEADDLMSLIEQSDKLDEWSK